MTIGLTLLALLLLAGLLYGEAGPRRAWVLCCKTPLSLMFVAAAFLVPHGPGLYANLILAGLLLGLVGDVCLALPGKGPFRAGLVAFLLGHVAYVAAFFLLGQAGSWLSPVNLVVAVASLGVFFWLRPHLGDMLMPVAAYILVITLMVITARGAARLPGLAPEAAWLILGGAIVFYLSDLFVARDRFASPGFVNRLVGLPLYYAGQFMLAFSVSLVLPPG